MMFIKMLAIKILILYIGIINGDQYMKTKADFIKTCAIKDPKFSECSIETVQKLFKKLSTGIEGFDKVHSFDPMKIKRITINQADRPISVNSTLSMAVITGFSAAIVHNSTVNTNDLSQIITFSLPKMRIEGNCRINGRVLILPLNVNGNCFMEPSDMHIKMLVKAKIIRRFNHFFFNVTSTNVEFTVQGLKQRFTNSDRQSAAAALEDATNAFLSENWKILTEAVRPIITKTVEGVLLNIWRKLLHYIPADYIISDIGDYVTNNNIQ